MRITKVVIEGLFGLFHHEIPFNLDERITIIHGPNGFGKTAILKMIKGLFDGDFRELWKIPFRQFHVEFDDSSYLTVQKSSEKSRGSGKLTVTYTINGEILFAFSPKKQPSRQNSISIDTTSVYYEVLRSSFGEDDIKIIEKSALDTPNKNVPMDYIKLTKRNPVHFIETQRLLNITEKRKNFSTETSLVPVVELYSQKLANAIKAKLAESTALSQSLDRTLPVRLVEKSSPTNLTNEELRRKLASLEEKRKRLIEAGLLDKENDNIDFRIFQRAEIEESTKNVLSIYLGDVEQKLGFFDDILVRIELLRKIVNRRFLYKSMLISREKGFVFKTEDHHSLSPNDLSSGEQHELVLLYDLLFNMKPNSLILIDEPELSLHVAWQIGFLKDLTEIVNITGSNFLIATHSPQIVHDRWDLTVELRGPNES